MVTIRGDPRDCELSNQALCRLFMLYCSNSRSIERVSRREWAELDDDRKTMSYPAYDQWSLSAIISLRTKGKIKAASGRKEQERVGTSLW